MGKDRHTERKSSWRDEYLKWLCGFAYKQIRVEARGFWFEFPLSESYFELTAGGNGGASSETAPEIAPEVTRLFLTLEGTQSRPRDYGRPRTQ